MKKTISIIIILGIVFTLASCGTSKTLKEEEIANAEVISIKEINETIAENLVAAQEKYVGKVFTIEQFVEEITETGIVLHSYEYCIILDGTRHSYHDYVSFSITLPTEEIAKVKTGQLVIVAGKIDSIEKIPGNLAEHTLDSYKVNIALATITATQYKFSGELHTVLEDTYDGGGRVSFAIDESAGPGLVDWVTLENIIPGDYKTEHAFNIGDRSFKKGDKVTIEGEIFKNYDSYIMKNFALAE